MTRTTDTTIETGRVLAIADAEGGLGEELYTGTLAACYAWTRENSGGPWGVAICRDSDDLCDFGDGEWRVEMATPDEIDED